MEHETSTIHFRFFFIFVDNLSLRFVLFERTTQTYIAIISSYLEVFGEYFQNINLCDTTGNSLLYFNGKCHVELPSFY